MNGDKAFDDFLSIDTMECIGAERPTEDNNIYQATYYRDLVTIFDMVSMEPEDTLVDFGCGLGRVLFYGNSRHYCRTTGIEADRQVYDKLLENAAGYQKRFYDQEDRMLFYNMPAQEYEIADGDNYFYFFNPFSAEIFRSVIDNIIDSVSRCPRDIYLMLYYPTFEYQKVMRDSRYFVLKNIVKLSGYDEDPDEGVCVSYVKIFCLIDQIYPKLGCPV